MTTEPIIIPQEYSDFREQIEAAIEASNVFDNNGSRSF